VHTTLVLRGDLTGDVIRSRPTYGNWGWRERDRVWGWGWGLGLGQVGGGGESKGTQT
jgi:hypothetical protein